MSTNISDRLANDIEKIVGFSAKGYSNEIYPGNIEHIDKRHGVNGIQDRSMSYLHELAKIGYVIENYDKIRGGHISREYKNSDGSNAKTVELQKKIDNEYYYVVEAVPDATLKTIHVVSAYKNKKDTFPEVAVSKDPSRYVQDEPQSNVPSKKKIPYNDKKVKLLLSDSQGRKATKEKLLKDSEGRDKESYEDIVPSRGYNVYNKDVKLQVEEAILPIREDLEFLKKTLTRSKENTDKSA